MKTVRYHGLLTWKELHDTLTRWGYEIADFSADRGREYLEFFGRGPLWVYLRDPGNQPAGNLHDYVLEIPIDEPLHRILADKLTMQPLQPQKAPIKSISIR